MTGRGRGGGRGRGQFYKNLYGRGGKGSEQFNHNAVGGSSHEPSITNSSSTSGRDWTQLQADLTHVDGSQYGAYKRLLGKYEHVNPAFALRVDYVQGDAYASPSRVRAVMRWRDTGLPDEYLASDVRKIALCDFVTRVAANLIRAKNLDRNIGSSNGGWSGPKGGAFNINAPGQEVLPRTSAMIDGNNTIELRFTVSLPAAGRTILGMEAFQILGVNLVEIVRQSLLYGNLDQVKLERHVLSVERQAAMRQQLANLGLVSFIANGAILPRASGAVAIPMDSSDAIPFQSPKGAEVTLICPDMSCVAGMGIPKGITLLTGGGFHGKSTLLEAIQLGVYNHIPGDGREMIVTDPTAAKIRAEDGRSVSNVDISPFISNLPGGRNTKRFSTDDASGSTSMASNIQEALEVGCKTLLIDEDSSATNLLVRDQRMQTLIKQEPITPLISKARALYNQHGVSTIIVIGGLGDWLSVSDNVIAMESYVPRIITKEAKSVVTQFPSLVAQAENYGSIPDRRFRIDLSGLYKSPQVMRKGFITMKPSTRNPVHDPSEAEPGVDLSSVEQIVEVGQSRTIAVLLQRIANKTENIATPLDGLLRALDEVVGTDKCLPIDLDGGDLVAVRRFELAAAMSRLRGLFVAD